MQLVCEKYLETMEEETAICRHSAEYCKFRKACIIHFLSKEKRREERATDERQPGEGGS